MTDISDIFDCDYCGKETHEVYTRDEGHSFICEACELEEIEKDEKQKENCFFTEQLASLN